MKGRRVVVTGTGAITPVGNDAESAWQSVVEGKSGITTHEELPDIAKFPSRIAGLIRDFDPAEHMDPREVRRFDAFNHYGVAAGVQALDSSGLVIDESNAERVSVYLGSGIGGIRTIESAYHRYSEQSNPRRISPFLVPGIIVNMPAGLLSIQIGARGPNIAVATACSTSSHSIGLGARAVAYGETDACLAGGTEHCIAYLGIGGFSSARALSLRNDEPERASRPWDRDRDGFVLASGGVCLMLEEYEHARRRGAEILAEVSGFGMSSDAYHITAPSEDGAGAASCMKAALDDAGLDPGQIDYINAHATSTPLGDRIEVAAIKQVFGDHAGRLAVSSTKSMTGHLLGAAGALEALYCILAIRDGVAPPTINLDNPDEGCDLDFIPHTARNMAINIAMSNSFGFGGTNGCLIFSRV
ncbi:MAG: beta-ketoacyl-ACP synthase II [Gammaproteobacteria bacterium]|nr:beta-ketoacyl-ACP synthase II [Gammaproteobacteria bacterium]